MARAQAGKQESPKKGAGHMSAATAYRTRAVSLESSADAGCAGRRYFTTSGAGIGNPSRSIAP
ncbi:protein of unknown function [Pararobbsia alpina]